MQEEHPMQEEYPSQESPSSQGRPLAWFLEYFGKINATMERIEQCQEKKEKYIEQLGDLYENLYEQ